MDEDKDYIELVEQARLGKRGSLDTLAELVRGRLYVYVYRIVLQEHLALVARNIEAFGIDKK